MDLREEWLPALCAWVQANNSVRELWLFGSRATGRSRPDSDVDLAIALMPPSIGGHDAAFANYIALGDEWQQQLEVIVSRHVSLEALEPGSKHDRRIRSVGVLLWTRDAPPK
jgi:predicted nucleotidyltransferase